MTALVEERAAILEFDAGMSRQLADQLAREMVLGRDAAQPVPAAAPAEAIQVGVDHASLAARDLPIVRHALERFPGTVRLLDDHDDPFARFKRVSRPGSCRKCGRCDWEERPIHDGQSARTHCRHCDAFGWTTRWYGKPQPGPWDDQPPPPLAAKTTVTNRLSLCPTGDRLSCASTPAVPVPSC